MAIQEIRKRIFSKGHGHVFTPSDFLDLGARTAVDQALSRLSAQGVIRRLSQGLYDYPKSSPSLGLLSPSPDPIAEALARKDNHVLQISPVRAANMLGLTSQVPAKTVYFTDGPSRTRRVGRQTIQMKYASKKRLAGAVLLGRVEIQDSLTCFTVIHLPKMEGLNGTDSFDRCSMVVDGAALPWQAG